MHRWPLVRSVDLTGTVVPRRGTALLETYRRAVRTRNKVRHAALTPNFSGFRIDFWLRFHPEIDPEVRQPKRSMGNASLNGCRSMTGAVSPPSANASGIDDART